jgi:FtsZ-binding cell division protein ZapB
MSYFLEMAKWSEIFSISKGFRVCFLGISDEKNGQVGWFKHAVASVGLFGIVFVLCLYAVIVTPLGLLTGGYFWAREVKEYIFWGDMHEQKLSGDSKILKAEIDELKEQIKEQIKEQNKELKEQNKELKEQNKELKDQITQQMKQILAAVAGKSPDAVSGNTY